jgi:hypothetical protein
MVTLRNPSAVASLAVLLGLALAYVLPYGREAS